MGRRRREREERTKIRQPILKKLCAALLRSFRGQHSEKMKESFRGNWNLWEGQQPFRPNPNGVGDRTTMLRRLLICAEQHLLAEHLGKFKKATFMILEKHASELLRTEQLILQNKARRGRPREINLREKGRYREELNAFKQTI